MSGLSDDERIRDHGKSYGSVQEMLDDGDPEFAESFRCHQARYLVRFRNWRILVWMKLLVFWDNLFPRRK